MCTNIILNFKYIDLIFCKKNYKLYIIHNHNFYYFVVKGDKSTIETNTRREVWVIKHVYEFIYESKKLQKGLIWKKKNKKQSSPHIIYEIQKIQIQTKKKIFGVKWSK